MRTNDPGISRRHTGVRRRTATGLALATLAPALAAVTLGSEWPPRRQPRPAPDGLRHHPAGHHLHLHRRAGTCSLVVPPAWTRRRSPWSAPPAATPAVGPAAGGGVTATLDVTPGTTYTLLVGGKGANDTDRPGTRGGWNGGGHGGGSDPGGGGGGASDIRTAPYSTADRVLVGGGGGGAGSMITYQDAPHGIPGAGGTGGGTAPATRARTSWAPGSAPAVEAAAPPVASAAAADRRAAAPPSTTAAASGTPRSLCPARPVSRQPAVPAAS